MRRLVACPACQRPHRVEEAACPFCGAKAIKRGRLEDVVRTVKVGGLLAFTAVTTAACYGAPMPYAPEPPEATAGAPSEQVPSKAGTAHLFVTMAAGGKLAPQAVTLEKATLIDGLLTLKNKGADPAGVSLKLKAPAPAFEVSGGVYKAIDLETVDEFELRWSATGSGRKGSSKIKGTLQLKDVSDKAISGTLLAEVDGVTVKLYFNAAR